MSKEQGKCPGCDDVGIIGRPCEARGCQKSGFHFISNAHWKKAHPTNGEGPDRVIGQMVGDFLVVGLVGAGGFGRVYLAVQAPLLRLKGALKLLEFSTDDPELTQAMLEKFEGEAQALAQLTHPNIVRLLKYGTHGERPYLVMEFVEGGRTLRDEMFARSQNRRGFSPREITHIMGQILNGLAAAHEQNIIHRDIKPENIMLQAVVGNPHHVRLLDFGLAKFVEQQSDTRWHLGSPNYMAPEQISRKNLGPWTDLYAVGVMAFEMLSGRRPFPGATDNEVLVRKVKEDYDPLENLSDLDYPEVALEFLGKALARKPEDRFPTADEFHRALTASVESLAPRLGPSGAVMKTTATRELGTGDLEIFDDVQTRTTRRALIPENDPVAQTKTTVKAAAVKKKPVAEEDIPSLPVEEEKPAEEEKPFEESELIALGGRRRPWQWAALSLLIVAVILAGLHQFTDLDLTNFDWTSQGLEGEALASVSDEVHVLDPIDFVDAGSEDLSDAGLVDEDATLAADDDVEEIPEVEEVEDRLILEMALGKFHTCVLLRGGHVRCWGANFDAELGLGHRRMIGHRQPASSAPFVDLGEPAIHIAAAGDREASFTCALLESRNVRCWGSNHFGQLGLGHTNRVGEDQHPSEVGYVELGGPVRQLTAGAMQYATHACALLETGELRCWGNNRYGQLGYGHTNHIGDSQVPASFDPVNVGGAALQVAAGKFHTCALLEGGVVRCWGRNNTGQLGYGHTDQIGDTQVPADVDPVDVGGVVEQISLGRGHSCAVLEGGRARCWGWNRNGQLGYGHTDNIGASDLPSSAGDIDLGAPVEHISAGGLHTCALLEGGRVRCWGDNRFGQLGYGHRRTIGDTGPPSAAGDVHLGAPAVALQAANYHTCAVLEDDTLRCWGFNEFAQLGYGHANHVGDRESPAAAGPVPFITEAQRARQD